MKRPTVPVVVLLAALICASPSPASAQQSVSDVLSFLLTNRSIPTEDFVQDEQAAAATRDAISTLLLVELSTLPISSSAGGFTYRLNPTLGTVERTSDSFAPFFIERSLTAGARTVSFGLSYQNASFDSIDGRNLRDGTLVATAGTIRGASSPFDVESLTLKIRSNAVTLSTNVGLTDRLDVGAALPLVRLTMDGQRTDIYKGTPFIQATGSVSASGIGDMLVRAKFNAFRRGGGGLAIGASSRLPTGNEQNLLGSGKTSLEPLLIGSFEKGRAALHADAGYSFGGLTDELDLGGAVTFVASRTVTLVGEFGARQLRSLGTLTDVTQAHPTLAGVDTIRLSSVKEQTTQATAVAGFKWNVAATWLVSANIVRSITTSGLYAKWIPTFMVDYAF